MKFKIALMVILFAIVCCIGYVTYLEIDLFNKFNLLDRHIDSINNDLQDYEKGLNNLGADIEELSGRIYDYEERFMVYDLDEFIVVRLEVEATAYTLEQGNGDGFTASMTVPEEGWTIAVSPGLLPFGSIVYLEDFGWRCAEDILPSREGIDIYMEDLEVASAFGCQDLVLWYFIRKGEEGDL